MRAESRNGRRAQESGIEGQVYATCGGLPRRIRGVAGSCIVIGQTALSPPAFEQCPRFRGCAPTGPLRPPIGARNEPRSDFFLSPRFILEKRSRGRTDRAVNAPGGGSRFRSRAWTGTVPRAERVVIKSRPEEGRTHVEHCLSDVVARGWLATVAVIVAWSIAAGASLSTSALVLVICVAPVVVMARGRKRRIAVAHCCGSSSRRQCRGRPRMTPRPKSRRVSRIRGGSL